ncbi:hypothetical protein HYFRA_00010401 [Hymenoscyphus fraxineus]|uniref:Uncharacterized protein n=1 Tax=Hymenoscyphus fraxineus TaxID=746836 RepID=A0A9N9KZW5_9HELO|nr:hypothetical protein HYFRA_00010401 [Hymenoscyphus fraxineus]
MLGTAPGKRSAKVDEPTTTAATNKAIDCCYHKLVKKISPTLNNHLHTQTAIPSIISKHPSPHGEGLYHPQNTFIRYDPSHDTLGTGAQFSNPGAASYSSQQTFCPSDEHSSLEQEFSEWQEECKFGAKSGNLEAYNVTSNGEPYALFNPPGNGEIVSSRRGGV